MTTDTSPRKKKDTSGILLNAFEQRMTRPLYAVTVAIVLAIALLWHFWT